ncbi:NEDD8-specific protease 1 [Chionoecetes opilio]|uniref:NEDD8-specific protease 1 n=1 Tax=Chionoecetes opilio TaxID=41210 RepID=A0A8J4XVG4_CHIOP|nr:NEDD8-specific protease 1 [Chionoecetes opilio]
MADYGRQGGSHWLLLSSYGASRSGQLVVYDSLYNTLSTETAALVEQLQELYSPRPGATMRPVQRQNDGYSCGLFAVAFAFSIALGQDPCTVRYDRASMAAHLVRCLEQGVVQLFPSVPVAGGR